MARILVALQHRINSIPGSKTTKHKIKINRIFYAVQTTYTGRLCARHSYALSPAHRRTVCNGTCGTRLWFIWNCTIFLFLFWWIFVTCNKSLSTKSHSRKMANKRIARFCPLATMATKCEYFFDAHKMQLARAIDESIQLLLGHCVKCEFSINRTT